jgi:hypothetical protein
MHQGEREKCFCHHHRRPARSSHIFEKIDKLKELDEGRLDFAFVPLCTIVGAMFVLKEQATPVTRSPSAGSVLSLQKALLPSRLLRLISLILMHALAFRKHIFSSP